MSATRERPSRGGMDHPVQNTWRSGEDPALREAEGIGTSATRADVIEGLKRQEFLASQGRLIVPTERGLALFGVLERRTRRWWTTA